MGIFYFPINRAGTGIDQTGFSQSTPIVASLDGNLDAERDRSQSVSRRDSAARWFRPLGLSTNLGQGVGYFSNDVKNGYSLRWNLSVQHHIRRTR